MLYPTIFDVIVIGGGHAGTEAALAAARMGASRHLPHPRHRGQLPAHARRNAFDTNDRFRYLDGMWEGTDGDHRNFDLAVATLDSSAPGHALANRKQPTFAWPLALVVRYVVPLGQLARARRMVLSDATQIIAKLEDESAWPAIQGTAAGSLLMLRARLVPWRASKRRIQSSRPSTTSTSPSDGTWSDG